MTEQSTLETATAARSQTPQWGLMGERASLPIAIVVLVAIFALSPSISAAFTSEANFRNIFANQSVTGIIALAMVIPLVGGYFDLSVAAIAGVANVTVAAAISTYELPIVVSLGLGIATGLAAGALNAILVAVLKLDPFITTLGTYILWSGLLALYTQGNTISHGIPLDFSLWGSETWLGLPRPLWLLMAIAVVMWFCVTQTPAGRRLAAIGSNETAARLAGFRVDRTIFITFLLSGLLAGIAGALLTSRNGGGDSTSAISYLFPALAAVFLGRTAITPGLYNVWGTIFGLFLVAIAVNGLTLFGAQSSMTQVFNGLALIISVAIATLGSKARDRRASSAQMEALHNR